MNVEIGQRWAFSVEVGVEQEWLVTDACQETRRVMLFSSAGWPEQMCVSYRALWHHGRLLDAPSTMLA